MAQAKVQRHYSRADRRKFSQNAKKGTKIWHKTSPERRRLERDLGHHRWGFNGKSPHTTKRKYKGGRKK